MKIQTIQELGQSDILIPSLAAEMASIRRLGVAPMSGLGSTPDFLS
jgi:hypothetical protein